MNHKGKVANSNELQLIVCVMLCWYKRLASGFLGKQEMFRRQEVFLAALHNTVYRQIQILNIYIM